MSKVPVGSAWIVLPFVDAQPHTGMTWGVRAHGSPASTTWGMDNFEFHELYPGTVIIAGSTHPDADPHRRNVEFVEVLLPFTCYINRVHFNGDSHHLRRIG